MTAIANDQLLPGQRALDVTRRARAALRRLPWLNEAQAAVSWGILLFLMAVLGTIYVSQASRIAMQGRHIQQMQIETDELRRTNAQLERDIAESQQLERLKQRTIEMGFVQARPSDIQYVVVEGFPAPVQPAPAPIETRPQPVDTMRQAIWQLLGGHLSGFNQGEASDP